MDQSFVEITESGRERARRSELRLEKMGLPYAIVPPIFYCDEHLALQSNIKIVHRMIVLTILAAKGDGLSATVAQDLIHHFDIEAQLTEEEKLFLYDQLEMPNVNPHFQWQAERAHVLIWALGFVDKLEDPSQTSDGEISGSILQNLGSVERILQATNLVEPTAILDQADFYHRLNAIRKYEAEPTPITVLNPRVVFERHFALSWLIGFGRKEWQDLTPLL